MADNIDYLDGDQQFVRLRSRKEVKRTTTRLQQTSNDEAGSTLISNRSRVYKGGGWDDRAYYLFLAHAVILDERQSSASIGFRCAMDRVGTPVPFSGQ